MLDGLDLESGLDKDAYKELMEPLNERLAALQRQAKLLGIPVLIVLDGWECSGKGTLANKLLLPLDPRGVKVYSIKEPTQDEAFHPFLWRFWNKIPSKGQLVILDASWYHGLLAGWAGSELALTEKQRDLQAIAEFERQLIDRGMVLLKCWLHIGKKEQAKRFAELEADASTAWRVTREGKLQQKHHASWLAAAEAMLENSNHPESPWLIVPANQKRAAHMTVLTELVSRLERAVRGNPGGEGGVREHRLDPSVPSAILSRFDLSLKMPDDEYAERRNEAQKRLRLLQHEVYRRRIPVVIAMEGWDAAGKGGAIKRITEELDPRGYEVTSISAPTAEEKAHPYWWRFWARLPKDGHIGIFDRTWYGRVLVERIEGFCTVDEWKRAYSEINEFEAQLVHHGAIIVKYWLHVDMDEQKRRFERRMANPSKVWKITEEDWRNREKWPLYEAALEEMFRRTSTTLAPWTIIEANDKQYARVRILENIVHAIQRRLDDTGK